MAELKVGFVGLGDQGAPMARNIAKHGHDLVVYDVREDALEPFRRDGVGIATSLRMVGEVADIVAVCVLDDNQARSVVLGSDAVLASMKPDALLILHSTVSPDLAIEVSRAAAARGIAFLDAPVSGGRQARAEGKLTVFCGGTEQAFLQAQPELNAVGSNVRLLGAAGAGQVCKICNNLMLYCNTLAALEASRLGEAYGLSENTMVSMTSASTGSSWVLHEWGYIDRLMEVHPLASDESALFSFLEKDLHLASAAAEARDLDLPLTAKATSIIAHSLRERRSAVKAKALLEKADAQAT